MTIDAKRNRKLLVTVNLVLLLSCSDQPGLSPFSSDGCSLFPDASLITEEDWCSCCYQHDIAYWRGGTAEERKSADVRLQACVFEKTGNKALARLMYEGVRFGGSPYFYNWYRWGYGWSYDRKYQALTAEEHQFAQTLLQQSQTANDNHICRD